ncbi:MAG: HAD family phosphatase, partial [Synergistaceae bacterium]|nr:HAD family phosphatase [Synergistaceae bacterium]
MRFGSVIFDLDGTLLDSMRVWEKIDVDFLASRGLEAPPDYTGSILAMSFRDAAIYTIERFGFSDSPEALMREWNGMAAREYGRNLALKPRAREYLERLKTLGVKLGIATSSPDELCLPALANNGVRDLFDCVCSSGGAERGKEFPDIFLRAAMELNARPEECLVFEDILPAIKSAKSAGMFAWAVYDESSKDSWEEIKRAADG